MPLQQDDVFLLPWQVQRIQSMCGPLPGLAGYVAEVVQLDRELKARRVALHRRPQGKLQRGGWICTEMDAPVRYMRSSGGRTTRPWWHHRRDTRDIRTRLALRNHSGLQTKHC